MPAGPRADRPLGRPRDRLLAHLRQPRLGQRQPDALARPPPDLLRGHGPNPLRRRARDAREVPRELLDRLDGSGSTLTRGFAYSEGLGLLIVFEIFLWGPRMT